MKISIILITMFAFNFCNAQKFYDDEYIYKNPEINLVVSKSNKFYWNSYWLSYVNRIPRKKLILNIKTIDTSKYKYKNKNLNETYNQLYRIYK